MNNIQVGGSAGARQKKLGAIEAYVATLRETGLREKTEHTDRHAVKSLLEQMSTAGVKVVHEPKRVPGKGAPDFQVQKNGQIIGYVETKPIGTNLQEVMRSEQIARYLSLSKNILITNYLEWVWIKDANVQTILLLDKEQAFASKLKLESSRTTELSELLGAFASVAPQKIATANDLAAALASRSRMLRDFLDEELTRQTMKGQQEKLYGLYSAFRNQVSEAITISEFADAFAQTLAYGLFLSKLNANGTTLRLSNAKQFIPTSFKLIQELVGFLDVLEIDYYKDIRWVVDEILSIINGLDVAAVKESLSFRNRKGAYRNLRASNEDEWRLFSRDPFIYFYEDYLSQYDTSLRKHRGVYYTPPPVVNFIVRATNDILKQKFSLDAGLADHSRVTVLDFACGTGTFVVELVECIVASASSPAKVERLIKDHVLKNIYAFEYLIAPYTIAHLKLAQYLEDRQIRVKDSRFNILLTNTLEPIEPQHNFLLPALSEETQRALEVKRNPILVITGNPPYSGHSLNKGDWITGEVRKYREGIPELSKPGQGKWLQDDYVKFIRFAQCKMDSVPEGVVAIITNNSYLDNATFRGMRSSLMQTFDQIYILDLHGSTKKKERSSDGEMDENVFDIQQGVAIALLVKQPKAKERGVWRADLQGTRLAKYRALADATLDSIKWEKIEPASPEFLFQKWDAAGASKYNELWSIPEIFAPVGDPAPGIVTTHDEFAISFSADEAIKKVEKLVRSRDESEARSNFRLCKTAQWNYGRAKDALRKAKLRPLATQILYRPFDARWTIWDGNVAVHRRMRVMKHLFRDNLALVTSRLTKGEDFRHVQIATMPTEVICMSPMTSNNGFVFPLYLYEGLPDGNEDLFSSHPPEITRRENLSREFRTWIDDRYHRHYEPEQILGYVFAVLHASSYRKTNRDFLRVGFPRIPFPNSKKDFEALSKLGSALISAHTMEIVPKLHLGRYLGSGDDVVSEIRYSEVEKALYINDAQKFSPLPAAVWNFKIGGYQVLQKYIKSRKGRELTLDEITHIENLTNVLAYTVERMETIDRAYLAATNATGGHQL